MTSGPREVSLSTGQWVPLTLTLGTYSCTQEVQTLGHTCGMLEGQSASGVQQHRWPRLWQPQEAVGERGRVREKESGRHSGGLLETCRNLLGASLPATAGRTEPWKHCLTPKLYSVPLISWNGKHLFSFTRGKKINWENQHELL